MVRVIDIDTFAHIMNPGAAWRGRFIVRLGAADWAGLDNTGEEYVFYRGEFPEVLTKFVPYNGITRTVPEIMDGVIRDEHGLRRVPMSEYTLHKVCMGGKSKRSGQSRWQSK